MRYLLIILFSLFLSKTVVAEDTTVEMLDKLGKRNMVFSQEIDIMFNLYLKTESLKELKNSNLK